MGDVISLAQRRAQRQQPVAEAGRPPVTFFFDVTSPYTYLAAERVDRWFTAVRWVPVTCPTLRGITGAMAVEERARHLRMPLVWPEPTRCGSRPARRVAAYAASQGRAAAFVLAAGRLAFCGGFTLDDPEILAEACAAAGLPGGECLRAASDPALDLVLQTAGERLLATGADRLPALLVGRTLFCGEARVAEAAAASRATVPARRRTAGPA